MSNPSTIFYPENPVAWRKWLEENHLSETSVWVVFHTKKSGRKTITWSEAVDVALCFGWIDSKKIKIDAETAHQFFSKRKPKSTWSKINKAKVSKLTEQGLMAQAGLNAIEIARQNGSWEMLDEVEALIIPEDLEKAFTLHPEAKAHFLGLSKSAKKMVLHKLVMARRPETRQKRIAEIMEHGSGSNPPR